MRKPTHTESDYTAEYLGFRVHEGSSKKGCRRICKRRGRKSKKGRIVRKFRTSLDPSQGQEEVLFKELNFFNSIYKYTKERLTEDFFRGSDGMLHGYDTRSKKPCTFHRRSKNVLPHTPKYIMDQQNSLIEENEWMWDCTYQVSYRATLAAFEDAVLDTPRFSEDGNSYEAKLCYRLVNGMLYLKKFGEYILIKDSLPKGGIESVLISYDNGSWVAVFEILEPYDKAEDLKESRKGILETDSKEVIISVDNTIDLYLKTKAKSFNMLSNQAIIDGLSGESLFDKMRYFQQVYGPSLKDVDWINMACLAAKAREYKYRKRRRPPLIGKKYLAISEGYYLKDGYLIIKKWGVRLKLSENLRPKKFDYIVIRQVGDGKWALSGKIRKRSIFRNLTRICSEFSWKDNILF